METVYANGMMNGTNGQAEMAAAQSVLNWNPNQLDIKTKSVEKTLEPLVMQVCICNWKFKFGTTDPDSETKYSKILFLPPHCLFSKLLAFV